MPVVATQMAESHRPPMRTPATGSRGLCQTTSSTSMVAHVKTTRRVTNAAHCLVAPDGPRSPRSACSAACPRHAPCRAISALAADPWSISMSWTRFDSVVPPTPELAGPQHDDNIVGRVRSQARADPAEALMDYLTQLPTDEPEAQIPGAICYPPVGRRSALSSPQPNLPRARVPPTKVPLPR